MELHVIIVGEDRSPNPRQPTNSRAPYFRGPYANRSSACLWMESYPRALVAVRALRRALLARIALGIIFILDQAEVLGGNAAAALHGLTALVAASQ